jgi:hypothetical protein|nr:MAG TPA: hypothetical protein [Caudoviricetes sp.]
MVGFSGGYACRRLGVCGMIQKTIAHIETTGQEVLGILRFETITTDAGWKLDGKRKLYWQTPKALYMPIFETYQLIEPFSETSKVVVNNKFEFIAYAGNGCLIGVEPISKRPSEQED